MSDRTSVIAGKVRGLDIHWDCATDEEQGLTWAAFYTPGNLAPHTLCVRCGGWLDEPACVGPTDE